MKVNGEETGDAEAVVVHQVRGGTQKFGEEDGAHGWPVMTLPGQALVDALSQKAAIRLCQHRAFDAPQTVCKHHIVCQTFAIYKVLLEEGQGSAWLGGARHTTGRWWCVHWWHIHDYHARVVGCAFVAAKGGLLQAVHRLLHFQHHRVVAQVRCKDFPKVPHHRATQWTGH